MIHLATIANTFVVAVEIVDAKVLSVKEWRTGKEYDLDKISDSWKAKWVEDHLESLEYKNSIKETVDEA